MPETSKMVANSKSLCGETVMRFATIIAFLGSFYSPWGIATPSPSSCTLVIFASFDLRVFVRANIGEYQAHHKLQMEPP